MAAVKVNALFKKAAAPKPAKKATTVVKPSSSGKATKGWFGGNGGADNLSKWYGELQIILLVLGSAPLQIGGRRGSRDHWGHPHNRGTPGALRMRSH